MQALKQVQADYEKRLKDVEAQREQLLDEMESREGSLINKVRIKLFPSPWAGSCNNSHGCNARACTQQIHLVRNIILGTNFYKIRQNRLFRIWIHSTILMTS